MAPFSLVIWYSVLLNVTHRCWWHTNNNKPLLQEPLHLRYHLCQSALILQCLMRRIGIMHMKPVKITSGPLGSEETQNPAFLHARNVIYATAWRVQNPLPEFTYRCFCERSAAWVFNREILKMSGTWDNIARQTRLSWSIHIMIFSGGMVSSFLAKSVPSRRLVDPAWRKSAPGIKISPHYQSAAPELGTLSCNPRSAPRIQRFVDGKLGSTARTGALM